MTDAFNPTYTKLAPFVASKTTNYIVFGYCSNNSPRTVTSCERKPQNTCTSNLQLRAIGNNAAYYLGDNTNTDRNTFVSVDTSTLTAASDTNIVDGWGSPISMTIRTSTGKLYR
jgi:hypothetical protein